MANPPLTLDEQNARTLALYGAHIAAARNDPQYRRAFAAVQALRKARWQVHVWDAEDGVHVSNGRATSGPHLCVTFTAPGDCQCTGTVAADGSLSGEPLN